MTCNMRHGLALVQEKGGCDYVIDCDFFREGGRAFDVEAILKAVTDFKDQADRLFQASVTPALLEEVPSSEPRPLRNAGHESVQGDG